MFRVVANLKIHFIDDTLGYEKSGQIDGIWTIENSDGITVSTGFYHIQMVTDICKLEYHLSELLLE